jgi:hypothetical protein
MEEPGKPRLYRRSAGGFIDMESRLFYIFRAAKRSLSGTAPRFGFIQMVTFAALTP